MSAFQDLRRLLNGVSLVAKELLNRSQPLNDARNGDFQTLISSSLKKSVVSATDLAGLTKGKSRDFSSPKSKETVVYFSEEAPGISIDLKSVHAGHTNSGALAEKTEGKVFASESLTEAYSGNDSEESGGSGVVKDQVLEIAEEKKDDAEVVPERSVKELGTLQEKRDDVAVIPAKRRRPRERRVPSTPFSRALGFAGLGAGLAWGTIQESAKRIVFGTPDSQGKQSALSPFLSEQNAERLALALCRMRGAALKLGQMLSIQDESLVPAPILSALEIVRQGADVMPRSQLNQVLDAELGPDWSSKLTSFDYEPMAAASIGQVHRAVIKDGMEVAMKIQYPGVADSIESDIENVRWLLDYTNLIPEGLYLDKAMKVKS